MQRDQIKNEMEKERVDMAKKLPEVYEKLEQARKYCAEHKVKRLKHLAMLTEIYFKDLIRKCEADLKEKNYSEVLLNLPNWNN
jgi:hypothetical protein